MSWQAELRHVQAIALLVCDERPEWDPQLVRIVLMDLATRVDGCDLARAALAAAATETVPSPKAIGWRGPHWRDLASCPPELERPRICQVCGRAEPECVSVRVGGDDHEFEAGHARLHRRQRRARVR